MSPDRSMGKIYLTVIFLLGGLWETAAFQVTGVSGDKTEITCSHSYASSNVKYFCKGACNEKDVLISSRAKKQDSNTKYGISDGGNTFIVTIFDLTVGDSGTYWCGVERVGVDTYNQVVLTVKEGIKKNADQPLWISDKASSWTLAYIGAGLGVVVLALAIALLIFFIRRNRDIRASSAKVQKTVHATAPEPTATSDSTPDKAQDKADPGQDPTKNIYSNIAVPSEPQVQQDGLLYSTVSFNKHADCSTVMPGAAEVTYSTVVRECDDTSTVYSNVSH